MGNKKRYFGTCGMVYTIVYQEYNGKFTSVTVYGPPDKNRMMELVLKEYSRLICLLKGNQEPHFPKQSS